ncbi:MAG: hypothetical protein V8T31_01320 [Lachnospiraceae bacterium]
MAEEGAPHGTLAVADYQSGRGRGRAWVTPHGSAIAMSICVQATAGCPEKASMNEFGGRYGSGESERSHWPGCED